MVEVFTLKVVVLILKVVFNNNSTSSYEGEGGGLFSYNYFGEPQQRLDNCTFIENSSQNGGGIENISSDMILNNCIFSGNTSGKNGGGINHRSGQDDFGLTYIKCGIDMNNCTLYGNRAGNSGGAIFHKGKGNASIKNTILYENTAINGNQITLSGIGTLKPYYSSASFQYSNIQGGNSGIFKEFEENEIEWLSGNIDTEPLFVEPGYWDPNGTPEDVNDDIWIDGDYHLKSQAGRWEPDSQTWVQDIATSPCIDTGDPNSPIGLEPFPNGGYINMGAYGGTSEASKSYFGKPLCETIVAGDINGDCKVDLLDMEIMLRHWLEEH